MTSSRREFLQSAGALTICFALPLQVMAHGGSHAGVIVAGNRLQIRSDGSVYLMMGKVELGQGIGTALAQMVAEELDLAFDRVSLVPVNTDYSPDESYTFSSISIQQSGPPTRKAAAVIRQKLVQLAASELGVSAESLAVADGRIFSDGTDTGID